MSTTVPAHAPGCAACHYCAACEAFECACCCWSATPTCACDRPAGRLPPFCELLTRIMRPSYPRADFIYHTERAIEARQPVPPTTEGTKN